jgi:hypothetical protein
MLYIAHRPHKKAVLVHLGILVGIKKNLDEPLIYCLLAALKGIQAINFPLYPRFKFLGDQPLK